MTSILPSIQSNLASESFQSEEPSSTISLTINEVHTLIPIETNSIIPRTSTLLIPNPTASTLPSITSSTTEPLSKENEQIKELDVCSVKGKMNVEIPEDSSPSEMKKIKKVLKRRIANELGLKPQNIKLTVDIETGETDYVIFSNDPARTKEIRNVLKTVDFVVNVNETIVNSFKNLPESCFGVLKIGNVRVNILLEKNKHINEVIGITHLKISQQEKPSTLPSTTSSTTEVLSIENEVPLFVPLAKTHSMKLIRTSSLVIPNPTVSSKPWDSSFATAQIQAGSEVFFINCILCAIGVSIANLSSFFHTGGAYFNLLLFFGSLGFVSGGRLQAKYDIFNILERSVRHRSVSFAELQVAGVHVKNTEIAALFNEMLRAVKPQVVELVEEKFKEPHQLPAGYSLHMEKINFDAQCITFQDVEVVRKASLLETEILLDGKCYIAGYSKIDVLLRNSNERLPDIEGIVNHFNINFRFYCKIDLAETKSVAIWFSKQEIASDIDIELDVGVFGLGLDFITESLVKLMFHAHTEEHPFLYTVGGEEAEEEKEEEESLEDRIMFIGEKEESLEDIIIFKGEEKKNSEDKNIAADEEKENSEERTIAADKEKEKSENRIITADKEKEKSEDRIIAADEEKENPKDRIIAIESFEDRIIFINGEEKENSEGEIIATDEEKDNPKDSIIGADEEKENPKDSIIGADEEKVHENIDSLFEVMMDSIDEIMNFGGKFGSKTEPNNTLTEPSIKLMKENSKDTSSIIAANEQNSSVISSHLNYGTLRITNLRGKNIPTDAASDADPYLKIEVENTTFKTAWEKKTQNPKWKEEFNIPVKNALSFIQFVVRDHDFMESNDDCGYVTKQIDQFINLHEGIQNHKLYLSPEGELHFDTEWFSEN